MVIKSVSDNQDEILKSIQILHCPNGFECDLTYGNGSFWKNLSEPKFIFDIQPLFEKVTKTSSDNIPLQDNELNNVVFDPPFLTYIKNGREHNSVMSKRFGGYYTYNELEVHYLNTLTETYRVLKPKGILVFKCQDIVHNHKLHATHSNIIKWSESIFRLKDLFILAKTHRMPSPQKGKQKHARIFHSYFLVLESLKR